MPDTRDSPPSRDSSDRSASLLPSPGRTVAVKVLRRPPSTGELLARRLRHPHLLAVYGVSGLQTAFSTVEMEYCGRLTLQTLLDTTEQPLPPRRVARWAEGCMGGRRGCQALVES